MKARTSSIVRQRTGSLESYWSAAFLMMASSKKNSGYNVDFHKEYFCVIITRHLMTALSSIQKA